MADEKSTVEGLELNQDEQVTEDTIVNLSDNKGDDE